MILPIKDPFKIALLEIQLRITNRANKKIHLILDTNLLQRILFQITRE